MTVELAVLPHEQTHLVVIASPVRKPAAIVRAWLQSLAWQVIPRGVQPFYLLVDDGCDPEARALLDEFVATRAGLVSSTGPAQDDFTDVGVTHGWTPTAMNRVGQIKDGILNWARTNRAEAVWLVDADLICDPMTLTSLWSLPGPITSAVYWTRWSKVPPEHPPVHAGPQVWLAHPYQLQGMGMEEWEFRRRLIDRQVTEVAGLGACTLIRRDALMKGVSFAPWPGNQHQGIGQGEDRHFCMRASALHIPLTADPWPDVFHVYHRPEDEALIPEYLERLGKVSGPTYHVQIGKLPDGSQDFLGPKTKTPQWVHIGDLVSLELTALEPVLTHNGPMHPPTQYVRGRLGALSLHPEMEDAILEMQRGETRPVAVHFGLDYPFPPYRGQRRLIRVVLIDHKPFGYAPVIEDELIVNRTGAGLDTTTLPPELIDQMREIHA